MGRGAHFYKDTPLSDTNEEFNEIWQRLDALGVTRRLTINATVGITETEIRHQLGKKPTSVVPVPRADARVWQTRNATATSLYLAASASVKCDITIE